MLKQVNNKYLDFYIDLHKQHFKAIHYFFSLHQLFNIRACCHTIFLSLYLVRFETALQNPVFLNLLPRHPMALLSYLSFPTALIGNPMSL